MRNVIEGALRSNITNFLNGFKVEKGGGRFREIMGKEKIENLNWWLIINTRIEIVLKNIAAMTQNIFVFSFFAFKLTMYMYELKLPCTYLLRGKSDFVITPQRLMTNIQSVFSTYKY